MSLFQNIFNLPESCVFHTAVPKNAFKKNNTLSPAEKRLIAQPFLPLQSVLRASLVQSRSFITPLITDEMDYEDILFFQLQLKPEHLDKQSDVLIQLYQKYIPKPCVILLNDDVRFRVNTALKKYNEADIKKRVITEQITSPIISVSDHSEEVKRLLKQLNFDEISKQNLKTVHKSYAQSILNYNIGIKTGKTGETENVSENAQILREIEGLEKETDKLRNQILKSKLLEEKINAKLQLKEKKTKLEKLKDQIIK